MTRVALLVFFLTVPTLATTAAAQNHIDAAKAQYEAAAYEEALATLTRLSEGNAPANRVEVEQYRALCFIALGHMADAERAVAALVAADPAYVPSPSIASPRVLAIVADVRKKELPIAARRLMETGRAAYQGKDLTRAREHFDLLLKLLDDPAMAGRPERDDFRTIAQGFVTLTAAAPPEPAAPLEGASPTPAPPVGNPPVTASKPAAAAAVTPSRVPSDFYVPAVALEQTLPQWEPPSSTIAKFEYAGTLRVRIGADGKVLGATIEDASHPAYDARLLQVAPDWRFKPAMRNGVPIESEKVIAIQLRPQE